MGLQNQKEYPGLANLATSSVRNLKVEEAEAKMKNLFHGGWDKFLTDEETVILWGDRIVNLILFTAD